MDASILNPRSGWCFSSSMNPAFCTRNTWVDSTAKASAGYPEAVARVASARDSPGLKMWITCSFPKALTRCTFIAPFCTT